MAPKAASSVPFIVSFGAEGYFLDKDYDKARRWAGRAVTCLSGVGLTDAELVEICEMPTVDNALRVIVLDEANKVSGDKALAEYIDGKGAKDDSVVLVAIVRSDKCPDIWLRAAKKGKISEYKKLKTWENNNEVVKWIELEAFNLKMTFDKGIPEALFSLVGSDLHRLSSELRKLSLLVGNGKVTLQQLKLVIAPSQTAEPYQVADAAADKDVKRAMNLLSVLYKNTGEDEASLKLSRALMSQVDRLIVVRSMLDRGASEDEIATAIKMHIFRFRSTVLPQARKHSVADLVRIMGRLCRLDVDVKGPARSKRTLVELAVLALTH